MKIKPDQRIDKLKGYLHYLDMTFDQLILEMKRLTYEDMNSGSEVGSPNKSNY